MSDSKGRSGWVMFVHWTARITGLAVGGLFLLFFIGEGSISQMMKVSAVEKGLLACIPVLLLIGIVLAWKWEMLGGIVILASVLGFNAIDIIAARKFTGEIEFAFVAIPGLLFLLSAWLGRKDHQHDLHALPH